MPEVLEEVFRLFGYYQDEQVAVALHGKEGRERIAAIMDLLRGEQRKSFAGRRVNRIEDFLSGKRMFLEGHQEEAIDLPRENVIRFSMEGGGFIMARPSGTEPKIRFYFCIRDNSSEHLETALEKVKEDFFSGIKHLIK